jgi:Uma2 family endonuclease
MVGSRALQDDFGTRAEVFVAPIDVILSPHDVVQPDIVAVENQAQVSQRGIEGPPLLVVEVLSPVRGGQPPSERLEERLRSFRGSVWCRRRAFTAF